MTEGLAGVRCDAPHYSCSASRLPVSGLSPAALPPRSLTAPPLANARRRSRTATGRVANGAAAAQSARKP
eukprot:141041-Chlamydomonas_euryale.AAC.3